MNELELLCECGCGTKIVPYERNGKPQRFSLGHNRRFNNNKTRKCGKYSVIPVCGHPRGVSSREYVKEHILVAEKALGKPLPEEAVVHHCDEDGSNNKNLNLVICQDQGYHMLIHRRSRALRSCGHADWMKCGRCGKYSPKEDLKLHLSYGKYLIGDHLECIKENNRINYQKNREHILRSKRILNAKNDGN